MLTGITEPTSGFVSIYGNSIADKMSEIQQDLGVVQQFDVLFDKLTVREHLEFVCEIKNVSELFIDKWIVDTLKEVTLFEQADKLVEELSGGMKRKLSLAMAIVTNPSLLILDEPTSGLDESSRQHIWKLIKDLKKNRTIIMSTQHLDEADHLADRICIMTRGQLLAIDTPEMIKRQFGFGYKITLEPRPDEEGTFSQKKRLIDSIMLSKEFKAIGVEESPDSDALKYVYYVPFSQLSMISDILTKLEVNILKEAFIEVEINSLEDAYLNIAREEERLVV